MYHQIYNTKTQDPDRDWHHNTFRISGACSLISSPRRIGTWWSWSWRLRWRSCPWGWGCRRGWQCWWRPPLSSPRPGSAPCQRSSPCQSPRTEKRERRGMNILNIIVIGLYTQLLYVNIFLSVSAMTSRIYQFHRFSWQLLRGTLSLKFGGVCLFFIYI